MLGSNKPFDCEDDHIFYRAIAARISNVREELIGVEKLMDGYLKNVTDPVEEKMKIRIAAYKYIKKPLNFLIMLRTWSKYTHVEIGFLINGVWWYYSSTLRGKAKGTRKIREEYLFKHPERWDIYKIEVDDDKPMISRATANLGLLYDFLGIFGFFTPFGYVNVKSMWYCSEFVYYILSGLWKRRISPKGFLNYVAKNFDMVKIS